MKRVITFILFLVIMLFAVVTRSHAQTLVVKSSVRPLPPAHCAGGFWKWNRRMNQYVWVAYRPGFRIHKARVGRIRYW